MASYEIYQDMATRTGGDVYIGVVGPVRTGKSTFIKRFMELMVLPRHESLLPSISAALVSSRLNV